MSEQKIIIDFEKCIGCGKCVYDCFPGALRLFEGKPKINELACFLCGHCVAICPMNAVSFASDKEEIIEKKDVDYKIEPERFLNHLKLRRSIRHFLPEPVSKETIETIIEAGRFSPTGGNIQDVSYFVCESDIDGFKAMVFEELSTLAEKLDPNDRAVKSYAKMWKRMHKNFKATGEDKLFFNAPLVIIVSAKSPQSAMIAAAHMETMIYALNLGMLYSGFTTRAIEHSESLKEYIKLKDDKLPYAALVVGYPEVEFKRSVPRNPADIKWG